MALSGTQYPVSMYPGVSAVQAICLALQSSGISVPSTCLRIQYPAPGTLFSWHSKVEVSRLTPHRGKLMWVKGAVGAEQAIRVVDKPRPKKCYRNPVSFLSFLSGMIFSLSVASATNIRYGAKYLMFGHRAVYFVLWC